MKGRGGGSGSGAWFLVTPRRAYHLFPSFVKTSRTHLIYGATDDYLCVCSSALLLSALNLPMNIDRPPAVKEDTLRRVGGEAEGSLGSYARVPRAGHLVVQMNPTGLAEKILDALERDAKL
ncbi:hypothetical protein DFP72DRAFT_929772 [Ephemerocybe angulata]|uniref:Uncharacterized protein n=1 Tax=Ephemerocybe angulata TaxID=980116 RepID=A0A8H6LUH5_9AGAR|nr:hypothetical protein DFP72DRAFT_929772 [Tulosesus angulatus]